MTACRPRETWLPPDNSARSQPAVSMVDPRKPHEHRLQSGGRRRDRRARRAPRVTSRAVRELLPVRTGRDLERLPLGVKAWQRVRRSPASHPRPPRAVTGGPSPRRSSCHARAACRAARAATARLTGFIAALSATISVDSASTATSTWQPACAGAGRPSRAFAPSPSPACAGPRRAAAAPRAVPRCRAARRSVSARPGRPSGPPATPAPSRPAPSRESRCGPPTAIAIPPRPWKPRLRSNVVRERWTMRSTRVAHRAGGGRSAR